MSVGFHFCQKETNNLQCNNKSHQKLGNTEELCAWTTFYQDLGGCTTEMQNHKVKNPLTVLPWKLL
jgi:hypothetical protein